MKALIKSFFTVLPILLLSSVACQRSPQYRKEEDTDKNGSASGYYTPKSSGSVLDRATILNQLKKRVMVLSFWNDTPATQGPFGNYAADELRRNLAETQKVIIPNDIKTELGTENFVQGDKIRVAQLLREGRRLGVSVLIIGKISRIVFRQNGDEVGLFRQRRSLAAVQLEAKLFDVQGGREIMAVARPGEANTSSLAALEGNNDLESQEFRIELTQNAIKMAAANLVPDVLRAVDKINWQGRIAKTAGSDIYVSAGRSSGLIAGDILRVMNPGDDIYDPVNGAYLGRSRGQLKGTVEVVDFIGPDGAKAVLHTGGNVKEGDLVELY